MKIAFWSPVHGQAGTSSNIMGIALCAGMLYRKRSILMQTHFGMNNLEAPLVGSNTKSKASSDYFRDVGLDALVRNFKSSRLTHEMLYNCGITLLGTNVSLLPGTAKSNIKAYEHEMEQVLIPLLKTMEDFTELLLIDVNSGYQPISLKILGSCELKVINLSQNMNMLEAYLSNIPKHLEDRVFYLFGNYDENSKYNIHNLRRRYFKYITAANSEVIPYHTHFRDSQSDGKVVEFIKSNLYCNKKDENYSFSHQLQKAVDKILKAAGMDMEEEKRGI